MVFAPEGRGTDRDWPVPSSHAGVHEPSVRRAAGDRAGAYRSVGRHARRWHPPWSYRAAILTLIAAAWALALIITAGGVK